MVNTLFLPELREMLVENDAAGLAEFCTALHPVRLADYMEGLTAQEAWEVLKHADEPTRVEIFSYLDHDKQVEIIETQDQSEIAALIAELAPDDRVDVLSAVEDQIVEELLPQVPADERRDIMRLSAYAEETAGAVMTTEVARFGESMTVKDALDKLSRAGEEFETIYYMYIVDDHDHLRGLVSARQLVMTMRKPETPLGEIMDAELVTAHVLEDQESVARKVARFDLAAIPVVDDERRLLGIITHDDIIDVLHEEAVEDAHRVGGVEPLDVSYLKTRLLTLSWKRGIWLVILFFCALLTAFALKHYEANLEKWLWLMPFIPLVISTGGNSGNQSAALIITALSRGHIALGDWGRVVQRELMLGLMLGGAIGTLGYVVAGFMAPDWYSAFVLPITLLLVVICGTLSGSLLPLLFKRLGLDPAMMSSPFVAGIIDILGIVIYMNVAFLLL